MQPPAAAGGIIPRGGVGGPQRGARSADSAPGTGARAPAASPAVVNGHRPGGSGRAAGDGARGPGGGGAPHPGANGKAAGAGRLPRVSVRAPVPARVLSQARALTPAMGLWGRMAGTLGFARRQIAGGGETDQFGFDPEFNTRVLLPVARLFYQHWFRVRIRGLEHVPASGPALIVANHSGTLPMDAVMLQTGLHDEHPAHRNLRLLGADLLYEVPVLTSLARKAGHTRACPANAHVLLRAGEVVGVFPEGFKGIGKPFADRYQLRRFGRGGFAVTAIRAGVPIVPCAIVGAEEIYPMVGNAKTLARLLGLPYFPITPLFPWLGALGTVPLPSRWIIEFCPPVPASVYGPGAEQDPAVVNDLSGRVRGTIQRKLEDLLAERGPAFG